MSAVSASIVGYAITPAALPVAGGPALITGPSGLASTTGVSFGPLLAPGFAVYDDLTLYVTAPASAAGLVAVTVHTPTADLAVVGGMTYNAPATVTDWPSLPEVRAFLRITGIDDDPVIDQARLAAIDYGNRRTGYRWVPGSSALWLQPLPPAAKEAALIHASRLYKRRDSIDGTVGWADVGLTHVGRADPDVENLYGLVGPLVFG